MQRFVGKLQYVGSDEVVEFTAGNAALAAWERYALRNKIPLGREQTPALLSSLVVAHAALGIEQGVDAWIESVDSVELDYVEIGPDGKPVEVPPTQAAASPA